MAVLIEGLSVIIGEESIVSKNPGGWDQFRKDIPNQTLCADEELARVGFMLPHDVQCYVGFFLYKFPFH
jgi:hypothetical protein